jgi:hypothetical protein
MVQFGFATLVFALIPLPLLASGIADTTSWAASSAAKKAADWISFPFGRIWWGEMKTNFPKSLASDIDAALLDLNPDYLQKQFQGIKRGIQSLEAKP